MKWFLEEKIEPHSDKIKHGDGVLFFGSCFSENIVDKGKSAGLNFQSTKFGTLFHPIPIARIISNSINDCPEVSIFKNDDRFYSWNSSTKWNGTIKSNFESEQFEEYRFIHRQIKSAKCLFITFGTSKAYILEDGLVVANCHKMSADTFKTGLSELGSLIVLYKELIGNLKAVNSELEIVLTVSPVRHSKEGLTINNRSKARLLMLCEELSSMEQVNYFPSYEMIIDELRDYRFYGPDLVHPSEEAVNYVWTKFCETYFSEKTNALVDQVMKYRSYFSHRSINLPTDKEKAIYIKKEADLEVFLRNHPEIIW